jgi:cell wall-associated NlpC family hydrolase
MKNLILLFSFCLIFIGCGGAKNVVKTSRVTNKVVTNALKYEGVRYKYGGTTRRGMDCSGLVYVAFGEENLRLPRVSRDMATKGKKISLKNVHKGDLLFFKISRRSNKINHVGLVTSVKNGQINFIHSTSSRGVIVSNMFEKYWKNSFVKATRVL